MTYSWESSTLDLGYTSLWQIMGSSFFFTFRRRYVFGGETRLKNLSLGTVYNSTSLNISSGHLLKVLSVEMCFLSVSNEKIQICRWCADRKSCSADDDERSGRPK